MSITTNELISMLEDTIPSATPLESERIKSIIKDIESRKLEANFKSEASIKLKKMFELQKDLFTPKTITILNSIDIYGLDLDICNAFAIKNKILIFDGILNLIKFYSELITIINLLEKNRPDAKVNVNGVLEKEALSFSMAGFSLIINYIESGGVLIDLSSILGANAKKNSEIGYLGAVAFLLSHEAAHIHLGHLDYVPFRSERISPILEIDEEINITQEIEFEADKFAFLSIKEEYRYLFISSVMFFMCPFAFSETFGSKGKKTHPLSVNRLAELAKLTNSPYNQDFQAIKNIINAEIDRYESLHLQRKEHNGDSRIHVRENMPPHEAYTIIKEVIINLKKSNCILDIK